ncbi:hypothetical protein CTAYLR_009752 [Chrysophaeum taylorii]|uniref:Uncharacterized protein n=1 Tax=Chrysophaeum taylorii TaxID=2483200 RepID=A0AAD7UBX4_9STRA|nr:hypothetical protein CTAYLR_009752 [Chrysophaeum taylorii]
MGLVARAKRLSSSAASGTVVEITSPRQSEGWTRREDLDRFAAEIIELHGMCCALEENFDAEIGGKVQHAGYGVLVQKPSIAIDKDSEMSKNNAVITRIEQRSAARHAIDATDYRKDVIVVGDPGIGKTRGSMFFAMQELLAQNKTVMRVGFKDEEIILFQPSAQGKYEVWTRGRADIWHGALAARDPEAFVLIDPPEKRPYQDTSKCRTIKFASNNANEHYPNADKDKIVLVTAPPTKDELCAMVPTLWTAETAPDETFDSLEKNEEEILRRALPVGCAPRVQAVASVHDLARLTLHTFVVKKLELAQKIYDGSHFGYTFEHDVCTFVLSVLPTNWKPGLTLDALELRRTVMKSDVSAKPSMARSYEALKNFNEECNVLMCMEPSNFPAIDFAYGPTRWISVRSSEANAFDFGSNVIRVLEGVGVVEKKIRKQVADCSR